MDRIALGQGLKREFESRVLKRGNERLIPLLVCVFRSFVTGQSSST